MDMFRTFILFGVTLFFCLLIVFWSFELKSQLIDKIGYKEKGKASFYSNDRNGLYTVSGERYNMYGLTAGHNHIAFNSLVKIKNLKNNKEVIVRINDRLYTKSRIIDLTYAAAKLLDMVEAKTTDVILEIVGKDKEEIYMTASENSKKTSKISQIGFSSDFLKIFQPINTYTIMGKVVNPKGWGVQIMASPKIETVFKKAKYIESLSFKHVFIQVGWSNKLKSYRLILGRFKTPKQAQILVDFLKQTKLNPIVKPHF